MEQQVYIVNWRIIHQPLQLAAFVHIPSNLGFYQGAVNGGHAAVHKSDFDAGSIDIERTRNHFLVHDRFLLNLFLFSRSSGF